MASARLLTQEGRHAYVAPASEDGSDGLSDASSEDEDEPEGKQGFGFLDFEEVVEQERDCIDRNNLQRHPNGQSSAPFSLAFSGGGIRAAAFEAGVLWRLAQENRLKDVEYLTAVSGGAYIASAFASHVMEAEPPKDGDVHRWYLGVVARTLCRMQRNAGDFVRDFNKHPGFPEDGSGTLPRWLDIPILIVIVIFTTTFTPFFLSIAFLMPITIIVEHYFGEAMRQAFCMLDTADNWMDIHQAISNMLLERSPASGYISWLGITVGLTLVLFLIQRLVPACNLKAATDKARKRWNGSGAPPRPEATLGYCVGHAASALMRRAAVVLIILLVLLYTVTFAEIALYRDMRHKYCEEYIEKQLHDVAESGKMSCSCWRGVVLGHKDPWWKQEGLKLPEDVHERRSPEQPYEPRGDLFKKASQYVVLPLLLVAICCLPWFGSFFLVRFLGVIGPFFVGIIVVQVVQYRVYGPVTMNAAGFTRWDPHWWSFWTRSSLTLTIVLSPFFEELRSSFHQFYKRCLKLNYFCDGKDRPFRDIAKNPYCPFVIMTGTSSDFQPPGDSDLISELSFSPLHCGSEETGYVPQPAYRSLAKCMALSGAGALDAVSLTMNEDLSMRFWLELLNLSWGDYVIFQPNQTIWSNEGWVNRFVYRVPSGILALVVYVLILTGWEACNRQDCEACEHLYQAAMLIWLVMVGLSFFSFVPVLNTLLLSPLLRQIHQVTSYFYVGKHPPPMLYVTDGGVKDCTSLVQLLWRKCERILLVLAAADPRDELKVLKAGMEVAMDLKIATFYDPEDPRRHLSVLFEKFKEDRSLPYLHIGISYCWDDHGKKPKSGHLFVVKNRLPPDFEGCPVQPLLTEEEVLGEPDACDEDFDEDEWDGVTTDSLGALCCCDCCHTRGLNCGAKFPHGTFTGYLYLTPQWCNSLARLAYEVSGPAINEVSRAGRLGNFWEEHVPNTPAASLRC